MPIPGGPARYRSGRRIEKLGEFVVVLFLAGSGRYGSLSQEIGGEDDLVVNFEFEALGHFRRNDGLDQRSERGTINRSGRHLALDELDVGRQVREVLEVPTRDVDALSCPLRQRNVRRSYDGDTALDELLVAVVHVRDVLFNGVRDDLISVPERFLGRHDFRAEDVDLRLVDAIERGVERKLVEGFEVDWGARADGRGNQYADEYGQQELPVVGDAPDDYPC